MQFFNGLKSFRGGVDSPLKTLKLKGSNDEPRRFEQGDPVPVHHDSTMPICRCKIRGGGRKLPIFAAFTPRREAVAA